MFSEQIEQSARATVSGLILAGGLATRMGQIDKGLQAFRGEPLVQHCLRRLRPQVATVMINANRHLEQYRSYGVPVFSDLRPDFAGPLAGLQAGLSHCQTPWLLSIPCDSPFLPDDLAERLLQAATQDATLIAVAATRQPEAAAALQMQPVFALIHISLLDSLGEYLNDDQHKLGRWIHQHRPALVPFEDSDAFLNFNTLQELRHYEHP